MLPVRSIARSTSRLRVVRPALSSIPRCYASTTAAPASALPGPARVLTGNPDIDDPGLNGGYSVTQPPPMKAQFRDPYAKWWDPQERRNFGEPIHEDNDVLGIFSLWEYTAATPKQAAISCASFIALGLSICGVVYYTYPDKPAVPREFPDNGLEKSLGGKGAWLAKPEGSY
ncbi:hypothetical protein Dda_0537 [Drechslerella dactyloides]|uniref:NADH:ubiquinone oxidoreductase 20.1kD subunit n=1 Tax=Drechslerella dactyloides TaxID=74499 RepID=A0AAD6J7Z9_DREDA|nr:hypothetical protein Dda_0537 [Drechslerella dactyloides]